MDIIFEQFELEFEIKPTGLQGDMSSILHIGMSDYQNPGKVYGARNPSIFFQPGSTKLAVRHAVNGSSDHAFDSEEELKQHTWSKVRITQLKESELIIKFRIELNGNTLYETENAQPMTLIYANIDISEHPYDTYRVMFPKYQPAKARMRKLKFVTHNCDFGRRWSGSSCIQKRSVQQSPERSLKRSGLIKF